MKFFLTVLFIAILSAAGEHFFPWWVIGVVSFVVSLLAALRPGKAFLAGFLGVGIFWLIAALMQDVPNEHILSTRMAALFHLPNYGLFIAVTVFIGGLVGGLSAWAEAVIRKPLTPKGEPSI